MDLLQIMRSRRSIRTYTDRPITQEQLDALLQAAALAPTSRDRRPCQFYVITERAQLETLDTEALRARLLELRPDADASTLESRRRTIRALEVALFEQEVHPAPRSEFLPKKVYYIGTLVSREERVRRIDARLDARLAQGLVEEVRGLLASGIPAEDLMYYGLEYKFVTQHVLGILSYEEMRILLANAIHQFAKRQMTWFRGMERRGTPIHWVQP